MILVSGEALTDFIPTRTESDAPGYLARPGGSPYNVAIGLGRLGSLTAFVGSVSNDFFGDHLVEPLQASSSLVRRSTALQFYATIGTVVSCGRPCVASRSKVHSLTERRRDRATTAGIDPNQPVDHSIRNNHCTSGPILANVPLIAVRWST